MTMIIKNIDGVNCLIETGKKKEHNGEWEREVDYERIIDPKEIDWGCFNSAANRRISILAQSLIDKAIKADKRHKQVEALYEFHWKWNKMYTVKSYSSSGCSDTAVREVVGWFHDLVKNACHLDGDIWEQIWTHYKKVG